LIRRRAATLLAAAGATILAALSLTAVSAANHPASGWPELEVGFKRIYNGSNLSDWKQAGPGGFIHSDKDGSILSDGGMGLLWYPLQSYRNFVLRVDWKVERPEANIPGPARGSMEACQRRLRDSDLRLRRPEAPHRLRVQLR